MATRSIEINRRHDQVVSNAHDTLQIGWFVEVLLMARFLQGGFLRSYKVLVPRSPC